MSQFPNALKPSQEDIAKMLACETHIGTRNCTKDMETYTWSRATAGTYLFNLQRTWQKLMLAARIIAGIENPQDVCVLSARPWGQRAVLKFAHYTGCKAVSGRFTPGTFTNQITSQFQEPRLLIVTDPKTDHQPIKESSYMNIPVIAFCNTDANLAHVDVAIPCNNKAKFSIGLMWWFLSREVLRLRDPKNHPRSEDWDVMVDLFFYRDPDEEKVVEAPGLIDYSIYTDNAEGGDWADQEDKNWEEGNWSNTDPQWENNGEEAQQQGWDNNNQGGEAVQGWDNQEGEEEENKDAF